MHWRSHGLVFEPSTHGLPPGCTAFAQSPQAVVFDDHVRVYFSTRAVDPANGKYLSHVAFVDLAHDLRTVLRVADAPVIALGSLGCFDEHGIFPMNVLRVGELLYGYTCGWNRRVSVSVDTAIGLAISRDQGATFQRIGEGPVLGPSLLEPCLVGDAFVRHLPRQSDQAHDFHMWYIFGTGWKRFTPDAPPDRTYKIGHAVSRDGIEWVKDEGRQIIPDRLGVHESQALPSVVTIGGRHHMFFCYRESFDFRRNAARGYRIGHAWSDDLAHWTRDDDTPLLTPTPNGWDCDMQCYPHAFRHDGRVWLLYNGNAFGRDGFGLAELEE